MHYLSKFCSAFFLLALISTINATGQTIYGVYNFNGTTDCNDENQVISVSNISNGTFTNFNRNNPPSLPCSNGADNTISSTGFASGTKSLAITNDDYYIFYLTLNNGNTFQDGDDLTLEFDYLRDATGPINAIVQYSYNDDLFQDAGSFSPSTSVQNASIMIPAPGNTGTNSLGIRIIAWSGSSGGVLQLDNVTLLNPNGNLPLAVEFASFALSGSKKGIDINWSTASETNNAGFEIYRASQPDSIFHKISSFLSNKNLTGLGTSAVGRRYSFTDENTTLVDGMVYQYKIVDIDFDGRRSDHAPKQILFGDLSNNLDIIYSTFPNPANDYVNFDFILDESATVKIEVFTSNGKKILLQDRELKLNAGANRFTLSANTLEQGIYFVYITSSTITRTARFSVIK